VAAFDFARASGMLDFTGRAVVVTGGSRGIGRAIAEGFLSVGADVLVCGRTEVPESDLPAVTGETGVVRRAAFAAADIRQPEQASSVIDAAAERFGRLDCLVNNAGGSPQVAADMASPRYSASIVALNLLAPLYCAQAANAVMQGQFDGGAIINIASVSGLRPSPGTAAYGAAKAGLINLTQSLAVEWAPKVRVNSLSAGLVATEAAADHYGDSEAVAAAAATVPLGRFGTPGEMAGLCLFLASPLAGYLTGTNLVAHGGGEWPAFLTAIERSRAGKAQ
jgi:NAD(P)-dependent dehydrogenase (short-subunit alcohol dehydrogenase family)